jgi:hypothetical protein
MLRSHHSQLIWTVVNLAGIALFLAAASVSWIEPELADVPGASGGDAFVWFATAVPVLGRFLIGNLAWLVFSLSDWSSGKFTPLAFGALISACWIAAYLFDNAHHGI